MWPPTLTADIHPDGIATLRLDQPERRNALSIAMRDALEAWATDNRVRVVILTAAGSSFCAGFDLCLLCDVPIATRTPSSPIPGSSSALPHSSLPAVDRGRGYRAGVVPHG